MKIVLIGAGNVAYHLGSLIQRNGHDIVQVYNRSRPAGSKLSIGLQCDFTTSVSEIDRSADMYIVALKDDVIKDFCSKLDFNPKLIVHTSGTCSIEIFPTTFNAGVIYPVQTFSKNIDHTPDKIPFCIEARKPASLKIIKSFINSISDICYAKSSAEREKIHLAAVIVNNFTNHLFTLSAQFLEGEHISFDILRPLILETALKVQTGQPWKMQTGPAKRMDNIVLKEHLKLLNKHPEIKKIYNLLTDSIIKNHLS